MRFVLLLYIIYYYIIYYNDTIIFIEFIAVWSLNIFPIMISKNNIMWIYQLYHQNFMIILSNNQFRCAGY